MDLALEFIRTGDNKSKCCTLSVLKAINYKFKIPQIQKQTEKKWHEPLENKAIAICWIPARTCVDPDGSKDKDFVVDEGIEDLNTAINGRSFKWRFAGGPMMSQQ